jgi:hypothetical protein
MRRRATFVGIATLTPTLVLTACGGSSAPHIATPVSVTQTPSVSPTKAAQCRAGLHTVHHVLVHAFCGPAVARLHLRGRALTVRSGRCVLAHDYVAVHIGTVVLGKSHRARVARRKLTYFVALVGKLPGDRSRNARPARRDGRAGITALNAANHGPIIGADLTPRRTLVLSKQRTVGRFNVPLRGKGRIRGYWDCVAT